MAARSLSMRGQLASPADGAGTADGTGIDTGTGTATGGGLETTSASSSASTGSSTDNQVPQPHNRRPPSGTCTSNPHVLHRMFGIHLLLVPTLGVGTYLPTLCVA